MEPVLGIAWQHWLVLVSVAISLTGGVAYIRDMIKGTSKPNLISWGLWALAPLVATGAALTAGADWWATVRTFISGFVPFSIFAVALFIRQSYWKLTRFDYLCGLFSILALWVWLVADAPVEAILLAVVADIFATIPTLYKSWKNPETETAFTYLMGLISSLIVIPAIPEWTLENTAFQIYLISANVALFVIVLRGYFLRRGRV